MSWQTQLPRRSSLAPAFRPFVEDYFIVDGSVLEVFANQSVFVNEVILVLVDKTGLLWVR